MKKHFLGLAALVLVTSAFGQVENDDMYFNSKDRAKLQAHKASDQITLASAKKTKKAEQAAAEEEVINPTDSYSARNVNPEFAARSNSQTAAADNQDYFVSNYRYNTSTNLNTWNNNFGGWYNNSWYTANYANPSFYNWNSPYYGSGYDNWGNPWCNPYYTSGYSSALSYYWGGSYGWGGGMGYGNPYAYGYGYSGSGLYNPWGWGYQSLYLGYPVYSGGYGYNNSNFGENGRNVTYGKRASRGGMVTSPQDAYYAPSRNVYPTTTRPSATGGRIASTSGRQEDYYNRSWRGSQQTQSSHPSRNSTSNNSWNNNWGDNSGSSWNRGSSTNSSYSPSSGGGGATRQSAPSGSGSGGRSRGRD